MRYSWIASILLLFSLTNANAAFPTTNEIDRCKLSVGHWQGTFTIKDPKVCNQYGGCTHEVIADVSHVSNNTYQIDLKPAKGTGGILNANCTNGRFSVSQLPDGHAKLTCHANEKCLVHYEDPRLTCQMAKQA